MQPAPQLEVVSTSTVAGPAFCERVMISMGKSMFATNVDGTVCYVLSYNAQLYTGEGHSPNAAFGALCWRQSAPWECIGTGGDVAGETYDAFQASNPEVCRWSCEADSSCSHFFYNATDFACHLR
ncbi:hypothetical protein TSOC_015234, partial [Tetrabaena socialis]